VNGSEQKTVSRGVKKESNDLKLDWRSEFLDSINLMKVIKRLMNKKLLFWLGKSTRKPQKRQD
jgi:hypothetical protein